jgi:trehalose 6-phosphate synthase/phosphatase
MANVGDFCRLHVRVRANTEVGQVIAISGNAYALGNSSKERVVKLVTSPESYPIWYTASPIVIPRGEALNYRYCLLEGGTVKAFERVQNMRALVIEELDTVVEDEVGLKKLEGFGQDSEMELFQQMKLLTKPQSEADKMFWLNAAQRDARLILVCYHLPVTVTRTGNPSLPFEATWNDSIIAKGIDSIADSVRTTWVGTLQGDLNNLSDQEKEALSAVLLAMDCIPVFIDEKIANSAYFGFCKQIMWPVFHNVDQLDQIHAAWYVYVYVYVCVLCVLCVLCAGASYPQLVCLFCTRVRILLFLLFLLC